jgi:hypothetical protein
MPCYFLRAFVISRYFIRPFARFAIKIAALIPTAGCYILSFYVLFALVDIQQRGLWFPFFWRCCLLSNIVCLDFIYLGEEYLRP